MKKTIIKFGDIKILKSKIKNLTNIKDLFP